MLVVDEYLAVDGVLGDWPEVRGYPTTTSSGCLRAASSDYFSAFTTLETTALIGILERLSPAGCQAMRYPHPEVVHVIDPQPLLDEAASIGARYRTGGLLIVETLAAGLALGHQLWFGSNRNIGGRLAEIAAELGIAVHLAGDT